MLQVLRAKWSTALALLIAVATAWMFASRPASPPPGAESEIVCAPEIHDTPCISKQQDSGKRGTPRGDTAVTPTQTCGFVLVALLALANAPPGSVTSVPRPPPVGTGYPRGPPAIA